MEIHIQIKASKDRVQYWKNIRGSALADTVLTDKWIFFYFISRKKAKFLC